MLPAHRPYPDELAGSAILRCCRDFNMPLKRLGNLYFGLNGWRPSFLGANPLEPMARLFRLPAAELLWKHTVFPYATATMAAGTFERALSNAFSAGSERVGLGAVTQNASGGLTRRRYCRACAQEDLRVHFESYWHRTHHMPGVWVCARHRCFLIESDVPIASSGPFHRLLPHQCVGWDLGVGKPPPVLLRLSELSAAWLRRPRAPGTVPSAHHYRRLAQERGWLSQDRLVSSEQLAAAIQQTFPAELLEQANLQSSVGWAALMMRPGVDVPFAPIKHALLQCLLEQPKPRFAPLLDHVSSGPPRSAEIELDAFYAEAACKQLRQTLRSGRTLTTEQFLRAVGCWGRYRHQKNDLPKLRAVVRVFRSSAATVKRLAPDKTLYRSERFAKPQTSPSKYVLE